MTHSPVTPHAPHLVIAGGRELDCHARPLLMGIVNVTPDSFYDGGRYAQADVAVAHGLALAEQGADLLDIGAESTRPGAAPVDEREERHRVLPVVKELARRTTLPISVDTTKSSVARAALEAGASIINDVSALRFDPDLAGVVAETGAAVVLMHMQGTPATMQQAPRYRDVVEDVKEFFLDRIACARRAGIDQNRIILDPGIGFGKLLEHNLDLLNRLSSLAVEGRPLLVGVSRKGFIGQLVHRTAGQREWGTAAAVAVAVDRGAHILRIHDVAMMADVVKVASAIRAGQRITTQEHYA